jgi:hypothetical protein
VLQVLRQVPGQLATKADGAIPRHRHHQRQRRAARHTATGALMGGCGS